MGHVDPQPSEYVERIGRPVDDRSQRQRHIVHTDGGSVVMNAGDARVDRDVSAAVFAGAWTDDELRRRAPGLCHRFWNQVCGTNHENRVRSRRIERPIVPSCP